MGILLNLSIWIYWVYLWNKGSNIDNRGVLSTGREVHKSDEVTTPIGAGAINH